VLTGIDRNPATAPGTRLDTDQGFNDAVESTLAGLRKQNPMSALGQKRKLGHAIATSALLPTADIRWDAKCVGPLHRRTYSLTLSSKRTWALTLSPRAIRAMLSIETLRSDRSTPLR
jgi:hypothetical protein